MNKVNFKLKGKCGVYKSRKSLYYQAIIKEVLLL